MNRTLDKISYSQDRSCNSTSIHSETRFGDISLIKKVENEKEHHDDLILADIN